MQIPILNGIYTDENNNFRTVYPRNLVPVPKQNGISQGYLRPADGINLVVDGVGRDRGAIVWNGVHYRAQGQNLVRLDNSSILTLGSVGLDNYDVSLDYSYDYLAIVSAGSLYYYSGSTGLSRVSDTDLGGGIRSVIYVDGYFMVNDAQSIVVTDLSDPTSINPLKYGSAETDPDEIQCLCKVRNEPVAVGRYTCEFYANVGGSLFPFQRIPGALVSKGAIGRRCATKFMDSVAVLGGGRNEPPSIWLCANGQYNKLATREIDQILQQYTDDTLSTVVLESRSDNSHQLLLVHLPDKTLVYDGAGSSATNELVWFTLDSGGLVPQYYRMRNLVWQDDWFGADYKSGSVGKYVSSSAHHFGSLIGWEFNTQILYNEGRGAVFHELELVSLTGRFEFNTTPTIWTSYSVDGETWSQEYPKRLQYAKRTSRVAWLQQGVMRQWRIQKFRGFSDCSASFARLEARLEPLNV